MMVCTPSRIRSCASNMFEAHPWACKRPCRESRMLGNLHVRFGEGDGETCLRKVIKHFISTLPSNRAARRSRGDGWWMSSSKSSLDSRAKAARKVTARS